LARLNPRLSFPRVSRQHGFAIRPTQNHSQHLKPLSSIKWNVRDRAECVVGHTDVGGCG
jgi:hypothetical protein